MRALPVILQGTILSLGAICRPHPAPFVEPLGEATFQGLGDPLSGESYSRAAAVSGDGKVVVGWSVHGAYASSEYATPFRWEEGVRTDMDTSPATVDCQPNAVSRKGSVIVGECYTPDQRAFGWTADAGLVYLPHTQGGVTFSVAVDVSADGLFITGSEVVAGDRRASYWSAQDGSFAAISPKGKSIGINGSIISADGSVAIDGASRWTLEAGLTSVGDLPGGMVWTRALAVSSDGTTIVGDSRSATGQDAFRWTESTGMVALDEEPRADHGSTALAVSGDGRVVVGIRTDFDTATLAPSDPPCIRGACVDYSGSFEDNAFIWSETQGMRLLSDVLVSDYGLDLSRWRLGAATGISDDGLTIVGNGTNPDGRFEAWIVRLPAPVQ